MKLGTCVHCYPSMTVGSYMSTINLTLKIVSHTPVVLVMSRSDILQTCNIDKSTTLDGKHGYMNKEREGTSAATVYASLWRHADIWHIR